jgi:isopentenyl-diphosphate delta-isomerase
MIKGPGHAEPVEPSMESWISTYNRPVDYILFIKADVDLDVNPNEARDSKWVTQEDLKTMFQDKSLKFTPWFKLICESMLFEWWNHLDSGLEKYMGETEIRRM